MGSLPTVVVKNKQGHLLVINVSDFDPKIHEPAGDEAPEAAAPPPDQPAPDVREAFEVKVAAATSLKALRSIADEIGVQLPADAKTLVAARAYLLTNAP